MPKPNIVYLHSHDTGRFIQPHGIGVSTPHLQRLAQEGVMFRHAFCAAPTCSPSRASLLTGCSPHNNGMMGLAHRGFELTDPKQHLGVTLKNAGYFSILTGIQHVSHKGNLPGYDVVEPGEGHGDDHPELRARAFIENARERTGGKPFFLDCGHGLTHRLRIPSGHAFFRDGMRGDPRYVAVPSTLPDNEITRREFADYASAVTELDRRHGLVIDALHATGQLDNTLIIATTDHGIPFPRGKSWLTDMGLGVYLIMRGPGGFTGGKVIDAMVSQLDLYPTVCEVTNIEKPAWLQSKSLTPLLGGQVTLHDMLFGEVTYHTCYEPIRSVRTARWKYIKRFDPRRKITIPNTDPGVTRQYLVDSGWCDVPLAGEELYDLIFDPTESNNLLEHAAVSAPAAAALPDLRQRLQTWMEQTQDPLLQGPAYFKGVLVNNPDDLSPDAPRLVQA